MNDKAVSLLEQYETEVLQVRKGRGTILVDAPTSCLVFQEYNKNPEKLPLLYEILESLSGEDGVTKENLLLTKEGAFFTEDTDGVRYILKTYTAGKECNIADLSECREAAALLARFHNLAKCKISQETLNQLPKYSLRRELEKHNKELRRVFRYLRKKSQKSPFEVLLLQKYPYYLEKALQIEAELLEFEAASLKNGEECSLCHGDFRDHNLIKLGDDFYMTNFEKILCDNPMRDLGLFLRKVLEKNNWSRAFGEAVLSAYGKEGVLHDGAMKNLYFRLAYPEKFWKIVNFYYNCTKVWIPEKNGEKLYILGEQEKEKDAFLHAVFG